MLEGISWLKNSVIYSRYPEGEEKRGNMFISWEHGAGRNGGRTKGFPAMPLQMELRPEFDKSRIIVVLGLVSYILISSFLSKFSREGKLVDRYRA